VAVDQTGNVYVGDTGNHRIRKITQSGVVTTLAGSGKEGAADGVGTEASFKIPLGIALDSLGNIYATDVGNNKIRKIAPNGFVSTLGGSEKAGSSNGSPKAPEFNTAGLAIDAIGNIYVADYAGNRIQKITPSGSVTTLAGSGNKGGEDGFGTAATFNFPWGVAVDSIGVVYVADQHNHKIRKIFP